MVRPTPNRSRRSMSVRQNPLRLMLRFCLTLFACAACFHSAIAQTTAPQTDNETASELLKKLNQLVEQNGKLEKQNRELMEQINSLRTFLAKEGGLTTDTLQKEAVPSGSLAPGAGVQRPTEEPTHAANPLESEPDERSGVDVSGGDSSASQKDLNKWGTYTPNFGFKVADTEHGDMSISIYTYARYLNQLGLNATYTDAFGKVKNVQRRQDFQLNKLQIKFLGWLLDPKFRYFLYAWTSNASQGLGAQVVLAGNLNYTFNKHFNVAGGITSLPGTRSVEGNFPFWLGVDTRLIADEFFRPSYTSGIWARGEIVKHLRYQIMLGNNLSTLGVSAAQLDNGLNTVASALIWTPTSGEFGAGFGDFEHHEKVSVRLAGHFTRSDETKQSQPNSDQFENTQLRLEDGSVIFTPNLFGQVISITDATYKMTAFDVGLKYKGYSLDGEYFL